MRNLLKDRRFFIFKAGIFCFASVLFVLLCVFSCNNLLTLSEGGSLLVSVPGGRNATDATIYTIELKGEKGSTYSKTVSSGETAAFEELIPDTYTILVKGSNEKDIVVYYGSASATVEAGKTASAMVELQEILGRLAVDFTGADGAGDGMSFTVEVKSSNGISLSKPIVAGSSVSFEKLIPDTYGVTVKGSEYGKVVYLGTASAVVEVGQISSVKVQLQNQFGELTVDLSGADVDSYANNFTVELHGSSKGSIYTRTVSGDEVILFERLIPDTYSIEVDGRDEQGKIMLHGTNSVDVAAGKPIAVTVELQPQFGSLSVDFSDTTLAIAGTSFSIELRGSKASIYHTTVPSGQIAQFEKLLPDTYVVTVKGTNENQIVVSGTASALVKAGESASITVELTKVAKIVTDAASLKEAIASGGTVYVANDITVAENLTINQDVTIRALDKDVTLNLASNVLMFEVGSEGELTLGGGEYMLTVNGNKKNQSYALLNIIDGGKVHLYGTITNSYSPNKTGIEIGNSSSFYMYDGATVSNCECINAYCRGGAIAVRSGGEMYMYGGTITGNRCYCAAAIYVEGGTFNMSGGTITGNTATSTSNHPADQPAAVEINPSGKFTKTGGSITGNSPKDIVNKSTLQ